MITAETLKTLTTFTTNGLAMALLHSGHKGARFKSAKFVGITNGGQFCYTVTYREHDAEQTGKVFLTYDPAKGQVIAGY
jgi:hypothetical protein